MGKELKRGISCLWFSEGFQTEMPWLSSTVTLGIYLNKLNSIFVAFVFEVVSSVSIWFLFIYLRSEILILTEHNHWYESLMAKEGFDESGWWR